eukprot:8574696-Lingulodinium_polyedra.AAC.1
MPPGLVAKSCCLWPCLGPTTRGLASVLGHHHRSATQATREGEGGWTLTLGQLKWQGHETRSQKKPQD